MPTLPGGGGPVPAFPQTVTSGTFHAADGEGSEDKVGLLGRGTCLPRPRDWLRKEVLATSLIKASALL